MVVPNHCTTIPYGLNLFITLSRKTRLHPHIIITNTKRIPPKPTPTPPKAEITPWESSPNFSRMKAIFQDWDYVTHRVPLTRGGGGRGGFWWHCPPPQGKLLLWNSIHFQVQWNTLCRNGLRPVFSIGLRQGICYYVFSLKGSSSMHLDVRKKRDMFGIYRAKWCLLACQIAEVQVWGNGKNVSSKC